MKKLIITAMVAVSLATGAFAADTKSVNATVLNNFNKAFAAASDVSWTSTANYAKATFVLSNERIEAFYDFGGELIATSKAVTISQLPGKARDVLAKKYNGFSVKEVIVIESPENTSYYLSAEKADQSIILKISDSGAVSTFKQQMK